MTNVKPATPLPWDSTELALYTEDGELCILSAHTAPVSFGGRTGKQGDVNYAAHAANAYPALIEAAKSAIATLEQFVKIERIPANNQGLRDMRALLRELGEL